jgi:uncharacterized Zn finger protein
MQYSELRPGASGDPVRAACPECSGGMTLLKIIPGRVGRGGCEYWTMRCTRCGGIHLDIIEPAGTPAV